MSTGFCTTEGHEAKTEHGKSGLCQACYRKKRREDARNGEPKQKPGPKPDPSKPYSRYGGDLTHHGLRAKCINGHEFEEGSYKLSESGKRICLRCIDAKREEYCPAGLHLRSEHQNQYGRCRECARINGRRNSLSSKYKLTEESFMSMLESQEFKCAICLNDLDFEQHGGVCVDHDHSCCLGETTCGKCVRGILCGTCNKGLGSFRDDTSLLEAAINYLELHN
jgi:hypothetical protein